jgi:hypothetical protein
MDTHSIDSPGLVLEQLEASIQDALHRLIDGGRIGDRHRESATGFRRRIAELQRRLEASRDKAGRRALPADAKADFYLLAWDFKQWMTEIDKEFEDREPAKPILSRGAPG